MCTEWPHRGIREGEPPASKPFASLPKQVRYRTAPRPELLLLYGLTDPYAPSRKPPESHISLILALVLKRRSLPLDPIGPVQPSLLGSLTFAGKIHPFVVIWADQSRQGLPLTQS